MAARPIFEVFERPAQGLLHLIRGRVWRTAGAGSGEPMSVIQKNNPDGTITLQYHRKSDGDCCIEFGSIQASDPQNVVFGEEHITKTEVLSSVTRRIDNSRDTAPDEVSLHDLFSHSSSKETEKSAGTSLEVSVSSSQDIEGFASFEESVTAEAHAEISESESSGSSEESGEDQVKTVDGGEILEVTMVSKRSDGSMSATALACFTFGIKIGKHSGGKFVGHHGRGYAYWESWEQMSDVVRGHAPDNVDLAAGFKQHPAYHSDLWALDTLNKNCEVRYDMAFEGRVFREYTFRRITP